MLKIGYIYIIKNKKNSKVYIGQTTKTVENRWKEHIYHASHNKRNQLLYSAMRKYGIDNFYIEVLEIVKETQSLDEREIFYINNYNSLSPNGYNMTNGGSLFKDDNPMYHEEIKNKVSEKLKGDLNPSKNPIIKEKIRQKALGKKISLETREKMSKNNGRFWQGKKLSEETRKKISENHGCRGKFGGLNPNSKKVQRLDKKTFEKLEEYESISVAIIWVRNNINPNASASNISSVCNGHQKTAFGYIWKFV